MVVLIVDQIMKLDIKEMMGMNTVGTMKHGNLEDNAAEMEENTPNKENLQLPVLDSTDRLINNNIPIGY